MLLAAAAIYGAYKWGAAQWDSRTGAALAIGTFVIVMVAFFIAMVFVARRDARLDRERRAAHN